jgi:hypothetical protein
MSEQRTSHLYLKKYIFVNLDPKSPRVGRRIYALDPLDGWSRTKTIWVSSVEAAAADK